MTTITLLHFKTSKNINEIEMELNKVSSEKYWIAATKEDNNTIKIIFNYKTSIEEEVRKVLNISEIKRVFNGNSGMYLTRNVIAYMHFDKEILEVRRGIDHVFRFFINVLEKSLRIKFINVYIPSKTLAKIIEKHTISLNQIYFKFVNGFLFEMYKGKYLQYSEFIRKKIEELNKNIRIITTIPKIKFDGFQKSFTINGDKGTIKFWYNNVSKSEISQILNIIFENMK
ncbi:MAG: hypothetical protein QXT34_00735 [Candidatus Aenigmatarchaeota archaeon]